HGLTSPRARPAKPRHLPLSPFGRGGPMLLRRLVRSSFAFWLTTCSLGAVTGVVVAHSLGRADAAARRYGSAGPVVLTRRALEPGRILEPGDLQVLRVPTIFVPPG